MAPNYFLFFSSSDLTGILCAVGRSPQQRSVLPVHPQGILRLKRLMFTLGKPPGAVICKAGIKGFTGMQTSLTCQGTQAKALDPIPDAGSGSDPATLHPRLQRVGGKRTAPGQGFPSIWVRPRFPGLRKGEELPGPTWGVHPGLTVKHPKTITVAGIYHALIPFHPPDTPVRRVPCSCPCYRCGNCDSDRTNLQGKLTQPAWIRTSVYPTPELWAASLGRSEENRKEVCLVLNPADDRHLAGGLGGLGACGPQPRRLCSPPARPPESLVPATGLPPGLRSLSLSPRSSVTFAGTYTVVCAFPAHPPGVGVPRGVRLSSAGGTVTADP